MQLTRRDAIKAEAAALAALAANVTLPAAAQPVLGGIENLEIKWYKAPCRFCGTGCGVMVGVKAGQVVATHGDTQAEVNRGLNCVTTASKATSSPRSCTVPIALRRRCCACGAANMPVTASSRGSPGTRRST